MPLVEFMKTISHREFRTWVAWTQDQLNNPSRTDYYLMQIAGYIAHVMSKKQWKVSKYKIPFIVGKPSKSQVEQQTATSKSLWRRRLRGK